MRHLSIIAALSIGLSWAMFSIVDENNVITPSGKPITSSPSRIPLSLTRSPSLKPDIKSGRPISNVPVLTNVINDWSQFGFSESRSGYNPHEKLITKLSLANQTLIPAWNVSLNGASISQPLYMKNLLFPSNNLRNVIYIGIENGDYLAVDAFSGREIWRKNIGVTVDFQCYDLPGGKFGVSGTAYIDRGSMSLFVVGGTGNLHRLKLLTGESYSPIWPVKNIFDPNLLHAYGAVSKYLDTLYITVAGHCDNNQYIGAIYRFNITNGHLISAFQPAGVGKYGAGIWGMPGISIDTTKSPAVVYTATGNSLASVENDAYGENIVKLTANLKVIKSYAPGILEFDGDFGATPSIFKPTNGCKKTLIATENKAGVLFVTDENLGSVQQFQIMLPGSDGEFLGSPAFDPTRNILYVSNPCTSQDGKYIHGIIALKVHDDCTLDLAWTSIVGASVSDFNNPWSSPIIAGGVVYVSTGLFGQVFAVDADTGALLWQSPKPIGFAYAPPTVIDGQFFVADAGPYYNGIGGKLWKFKLGPKPPTVPVIYSDIFNVVINSVVYNLKPALTSVVIDVPTQVHLQRNFYATVYNSIYGMSRHYMRLPIAGIPSLAGLPNGVNWQYTDIWMISDSGKPLMLGKYDKSTWVKNNDGTIQVTYKHGSYCSPTDDSALVTRTTTVIIACGISPTIQNDIQETSTCSHSWTISSVQLCTMLYVTPPTLKPTSKPIPSTKPITTKRPVSRAPAVTLSPNSILYGGSGGNAFSLTCPTGSFVTGFYGRGGWWVDAIGITCGTTNIGIVGGTGGGAMSSGICSAGINMISLSWGDAVGQILPICSVAGTPLTAIGTADSSGIGSGHSGNFICPSLTTTTKRVITGISGFVSTYMNSIRFIC